MRKRCIIVVLVVICSIFVAVSERGVLWAAREIDAARDTEAQAVVATGKPGENLQQSVYSFVGSGFAGAGKGLRTLYQNLSQSLFPPKVPVVGEPGVPVSEKARLERAAVTPPAGAREGAPPFYREVFQMQQEIIEEYKGIIEDQQKIIEDYQTLPERILKTEEPPEEMQALIEESLEAEEDKLQAEVAEIREAMLEEEELVEFLTEDWFFENAVYLPTTASEGEELAALLEGDVGAAPPFYLSKRTWWGLAAVAGTTGTTLGSVAAAGVFSGGGGGIGGGFQVALLPPGGNGGAPNGGIINGGAGNGNGGMNGGIFPPDGNGGLPDGNGDKAAEPIPEVSSMFLLAVGLVGLFFLKK